jgi:hypothetical protein
MPEIAGIRASHNPKVAGSNPAPAMQEPPLARGLLRLREEPVIQLGPKKVTEAVPNKVGFGVRIDVV